MVHTILNLPRQSPSQPFQNRTRKRAIRHRYQPFRQNRVHPYPSNSARPPPLTQLQPSLAPGSRSPNQTNHHAQHKQSESDSRSRLRNYTRTVPHPVQVQPETSLTQAFLVFSLQAWHQTTISVLTYLLTCPGIYILFSLPLIHR